MVEVPALSGMALDQARQLLDAKGLRLVVFERRPDLTQPAERVVKQAPLSGSTVAAASPIYLVLSSGLPKGAAAVIVGAAQPAGAAALAPAKVAAVVAPAVQGAPAAAPVAAPVAAPAPAPAPAASELKAVPSLVGTRATAAAGVLTNAGLKLGRRRYKVDEDRAPGLILRQSPAAGTKVASGTAVEIWINGE